MSKGALDSFLTAWWFSVFLSTPHLEFEVLQRFGVRKIIPETVPNQRFNIFCDLRRKKRNKQPENGGISYIPLWCRNTLKNEVKRREMEHDKTP